MPRGWRLAFRNDRDLAELKSHAFGQNLPDVTLAHPWAHEVLKAHGKVLCYWAAMNDGAPLQYRTVNAVRR